MPEAERSEADLIRGRLPLAWTPRATPLDVRAVAADGPRAYALGRRLTSLDDEVLARLAAVAADGLLLVLGDDLPWVDGAAYLGTDPAAPSLLLPTALAPTIPAAALAHAIGTRLLGITLVAVLAAPTRLVPCVAARAIDRSRLARWLAAAPFPGVSIPDVRVLR